MNESPISVPELEEFALELARLAGSIALANFRRNVDIKNKDAAGFDPVTSADHAIEQILRTTILERYPDHGIVGEEQGRT
ncbi:MAG: inositol monophosphatase family protein, partial [Gammaproteobacteria bacterium]